MLGKAVFRDFCRMFRCALFASVFLIFCGTVSAYAYTVTYNCGFYADETTPPPSDTATNGTSFTPAANTCLPTNGATFAGWVVSGTGDVKQSGESFVWNYDEDKTFTAIWECYWNSDETECVPGYTITLTSGSNCQNVWGAPTKLYTIKGRGVYIGPERTESQLVLPKSQNGGQNPITKTVTYTNNLDTSNTPINPVTGQRYVLNGSFTTPISGTRGFQFMQFDYYHNGYIFDSYFNSAIELNGNTSWNYKFSGAGSVPLSFDSKLAGYNIEWYDAQNVSITATPADSNCNTMTNTIYAQWNPITYGITYELAGGEWGENVDVVETAEYDKEFKVEHPVHNDGYIFAGWNIGTLDENTHYYSDSHIFVNGVYQSGTTQTSSGKSINGTKAKYFMNLRSTPGTYNLKFTAQWECDTANGYHWDTESETCTNVYNITYHNVDGDWISDQPVSYTYGNATQIRAPSKTGYVFLGWCVNDENCANYENNVNYTIPATSNTDIDLYAQWDCDNANNWWWNAYNTACVRGYTITLQQPESCDYSYNPSVPTMLYVIPNIGIYRDSQRNQLMIQQNQNGGQYQIEMPTATCVVKRNFGNLPRNPVTNELYEPISSVTHNNLGTVSMSDIERTISATSFNFQNQEIMSNFCTNNCTYNAIDSNGYITAYGSALSAVDTDMTWTLSMEPVSVTL
ncbi:MAG: InlB B-repeat-containing protein, partial [Alphaproteobacteria bacterium]|nr:InlB B-repeat-containing protein [Alphaproteobacteria bacterium]